MPVHQVATRVFASEYADLEPYYTRIFCHQCCHGIGPHSITLPSGKKTTVRRVHTQTAAQKIIDFNSAPAVVFHFPSKPFHFPIYVLTVCT